jgi:hypothetical protein
MTTDDKEMCAKLRATRRVRYTAPDGPTDLPINPDGPEAADRIEQLSSGGWMPIESAPNDGSSILLRGEDGFHSIAYWDGRNWQVMGDGQMAVRYMSDFGTEYLTHDYPTHWQPLPSPPALQSLQVGGE